MLETASSEFLPSLDETSLSLPLFVFQSAAVCSWFRFQDPEPKQGWREGMELRIYVALIARDIDI